LLGFLISVEHGLFGFRDGWAAPFAHQAFEVEVASVVVLAMAAVLGLVGPAPDGRSEPLPADSLQSAAG
jgi:hypothetical protein